MKKSKDTNVEVKMKFLDKLGLVIFSILVLILSVVALGVTTGWIA